MARLVEALASATGHGPDRARRWRRAARFHDIGKLAVPDGILGKRTELTPAERDVVRRHPALGERLLSRWSSPAADLAAAVARSHHERWDGAGYPDGLSGTEIPAAARTTAVADALDVMLTGRPYAPPISVPAALEELEAQAGRQFDPELVRHLRRALRRPLRPAQHWDVRSAAPAADAVRNETTGGGEQPWGRADRRDCPSPVRSAGPPPARWTRCGRRAAS